MDPQFEAVQLEGDSAIKVFSLQCSVLKDNHSWHYHPECELTYVVKGEGTRFIGDSVQTFGPGDLIFLGPNLPHCWTNTQTADSHSSDNDFLVLQFKPECLGAEFLNSPDAQRLRQLVNDGMRGLKFSGPDVTGIVDKLQSLQRTTGLRRLSEFIYLLDLLCQCRATTPLSSETYVTDTEEFHSGRMEKVMDYVRKHLAYEIKQSDVAELVGLTPQGFSRFFKATTGRTFVSFVNVMRIMEACRLLVTTKEDIIEIAYECGYANLSNFNRRFADLKQTTPREYRNQYSNLL
ncbi:AraC family transcriptional regulator (plasmid) [Alteromonas sp. I4]|nr:AraC family transcriptional regulator [Alteromonas sp. I4]